MKTTALLIAALLWLPTPSFAQFVPPDVMGVQVVGADRSVLEFPRTARLVSFSIEPGVMMIRTTGTEGWPAVAIDDSGEPSQAGTLWIALKIGGVWYATGAERLRPSQLNGPKPEAEKPGELAILVGTGWLYDPSRWRPMAGYNPAYGEPVCVMVAAGSTRSDFNVPVRARTQWLCLSWPNGSTLWQEGDAPQEPKPPIDPPHPPQPSTDLAPLSEQLERIYADLVKRDEARAAQIAAAQADLAKRIDNPGWVSQVFSNRYVQLAIAAVGTYVTTHQMQKP